MSDGPIMGVVRPALGVEWPGSKMAKGGVNRTFQIVDRPPPPAPMRAAAPTELDTFIAMLNRVEVAYLKIELGSGNVSVTVSPAGAAAERAASRLQGNPSASTYYEFDATGALVLIHMDCP